MTISKAQIFNITLNILGVSTPLENTERNDDNRAILLNNFYEIAKDYVLKDFDWNFASCFKELSLKDTDEKVGKYRYIFEYPNDCICARDMFEVNSYILQKFIVSSISTGEKIIATDINKPILRYTKRVDKEIYFTSEFSIALSYYLASVCSSVITGSLQKGEIAFDKYTKFIKHAKLLNAKEGTDVIYDDELYLNERG